jgi:hypothetical protein
MACQTARVIVSVQKILACCHAEELFESTGKFGHGPFNSVTVVVCEPVYGEEDIP